MTGIHHQLGNADTLMKSSGVVGCCRSNGKFGFHSLRKSFIQGLQSLGMASELRAAHVGHELDDGNHAVCSKAPTMQELLKAVKKLDWGVVQVMSWGASHVVAQDLRLRCLK